jgi:organic hydroperoxide reductase OsmC/OhrA
VTVGTAKPPRRCPGAEVELDAASSNPVDQLWVGGVSSTAMSREHRYEVTVVWTGNLGEGTSSYQGFSRDHEVRGSGKPTLPGSSDPSFRGDPARYNPEELLVAALSQCHMLWFLYLCSTAGVVVTGYQDQAEGTMVEIPRDQGGYFREVVLRPHVEVKSPDVIAVAEPLHDQAHRLCFIANSVNFPVRCEPTFIVSSAAPAP